MRTAQHCRKKSCAPPPGTRRTPEHKAGRLIPRSGKRRLTTDAARKRRHARQTPQDAGTSARRPAWSSSRHGPRGAGTSRKRGNTAGTRGISAKGRPSRRPLRPVPNLRRRSSGTDAVRKILFPGTLPARRLSRTSGGRQKAHRRTFPRLPRRPGAGPATPSPREKLPSGTAASSVRRSRDADAGKTPLPNGAAVPHGAGRSPAARGRTSRCTPRAWCACCRERCPSP